MHLSHVDGPDSTPGIMDTRVIVDGKVEDFHLIAVDQYSDSWAPQHGYSPSLFNGSGQSLCEVGGVIATPKIILWIAFEEDLDSSSEFFWVHSPK